MKLLLPETIGNLSTISCFLEVYFHLYWQPHIYEVNMDQI